MQYEYTIAKPVSAINHPDPAENFVALLNHYGKEGWEFTTMLMVQTPQGPGAQIIIRRPIIGRIAK